ncbi:RIP metalloprotease RseP [Gaopeijia maritima]|uniref:Zinc metalloprotease n=1 Tax=Gaopeijia maritima TaxID=3119007 RepID=A0ABU9EBW2_9BACT
MTIIATIVVLGVLIFVHELGHFAAAKSVGIEVQRFSIGLGPRVWGFTRGETEYVLSAIPLGGYVKMGGMDDEVMERVEGGAVSDEPRVPGPRDFDGKPIWARAWVISAGVIMNMLFAFAAYTFVVGWWGIPHAETTQLGLVQESILPEGTEALTDLTIGSWVTEVGGEPVEHWGEVQQALLTAPTGPTTVVTRDPAASVTIQVPADAEARRLLASALQSWTDPVIGVVAPSSPAERGGLESGDRILAVDGVAITNWWDFQALVRDRLELGTTLSIERDGRRLERIVTPAESVADDPATGEEIRVGAIGVTPFADQVFERVGWGQAVVYGWDQTVYITGVIVGFLRDLVTGGISPRSMGSIVTIGEASGQAASLGMDSFLSFMALFSINLAVLNLLPIPILDGGHLLFLAIEAVRGRALSVEQRLRWSNVGFLIIMGIMVWALGNDMLRLFGL